jgi:hypothetical protein
MFKTESCGRLNDLIEFYSESNKITGDMQITTILPPE